MSTPYQTATFLLSVAEVKQLPPDQGIEVAMVGRSNAGKSSVLNRMTHKGLARVSKTPGRTQHINIFVLDDKRRLADLPGYGYASVPLAAKLKWQKTVDAYLKSRQCLRGLILVMDIRHPMRDLDLQLLEFCEHMELPVHILLNKADKLSRGAAAKIEHEVASALTRYHNSVSVQVFSALRGTGLLELKKLLNQWYDFSEVR